LASVVGLSAGAGATSGSASQLADAGILAIINKTIELINFLLSMVNP
jgi:hypothetical protein